MIISQLICVVSFLFLPGQYVFDDADLISSEEKVLLNERLNLLEESSNIRVGVITTLTLENDVQMETILSKHRKTLVSDSEQQADSTLFILLVADEGICYFFSGNKGKRLEIPEESRFAIEEYGFTMLEDGYYYQGVENILDGLLKKWGENGEFITERSKAERAHNLPEQFDNAMSGGSQLILAFLTIVSTVGIVLFIGAIIYIIIILIKRLRANNTNK